ncbi:MAG: hydrolase of the superfamily (permuted catalytic motifs)-like protein [Candidatus Solibacter sp.]|jgi:CRISPR-associated protein Csm1|nr:hydrolase of the superfamily (permuted catalytic motifs)-like protein [Candidatus Solibacter sp.]
MPEQILLQGKILGTEEFLLAGAAEGRSVRSAGEDLLAGKSQWITLLCEVLPRALLAELGLARILLGSSGGGQFLLVLPGEFREAAEKFLQAAAVQISELSGGRVSLVWAVTANLGDWAIIRRRLNDELEGKTNAPLHQVGAAAFTPYVAPPVNSADQYFAKELGAKVREAQTLGWSPENPGKVIPGAGKHTWPVSSNLSPDGILLARHAAPSDDGKQAAPVQTLARRAQGRSIWGVLRGDVDKFGLRLRRVHSIEEHVPLSVLYKQFFAGELEVLCSLPEFWRKVSIIYSGGDDFAVYGSWDALIALAREIQRLFHRFTEENLKEYPGAEGKTISMAIALAPETYFPLATVYEEAGRNLDLAKSSDRDCIYLLGRILEWRHLNDAAELKDTVTRLIHDFRMSKQFLYQLRSFYRRDAYGAEADVQRTWRFQRRFNRILSGTRDREFQKLRAHLIGEMIGKKSAEVKLRPAGLVALEWARLVTEV